MVFDNGEYQENRNTNAAQRLQALRAASCVKILGKGVIKVVHRVDDAKENNNLGRYKFKKKYLGIFNAVTEYVLLSHIEFATTKTLKNTYKNRYAKNDRMK